MLKKLLLLLALALGCQNYILAQDDLMGLLDEPKGKEVVTATFKGSRVILGHSVKTKRKNELEFLISHRFGRINTGAHEFFGLDAAFIRLGLEYGITDNINVGIGRSSFDKTIDSFLKWKIVKQTKGEGGAPVSVVLFNSIAVRTTPKQDDDPSYDFQDRLATTHQIIIGRKFSPALSLQLMPTYIHKNRVAFFDENDQIALGFAGRIMITKSVGLTSEYYYRLAPADNEYQNSLSIGFDIETGGHVFQLHFTNSRMTVERAFITETDGEFFEGDIHFGFNISRTFQMGK